MSKKLQQTNRLNTLFANLEGQDRPVEAALVKFQAPVQPVLLSGWTWKADPDGNYISCSPDLVACLGLPPNEFIGRPMRTYRINPRSVTLLGNLFDSNCYPSEAVVHIRHAKGHWLPVRIHILSGPVEGSPASGWNGFAQILSPEEVAATLPIPEGLVERIIMQSALIPPPVPPALRPSFKSPRQNTPLPLANVLPDPIHGIMVDAFGTSRAAYPITHLGQDALLRHELSTAPAAPGQPAALAVSFQAADMGDMLLEVVDDLQDRTWTEDERQMVSEVASQLALALDNARLFRAAQQELAERERAEKIILQRNQDLSTLNQIGQRLSHLATRREIFSVLAELVELVMDSTNYYLCISEPPSQLLTFPLVVEGGIAVQLPERPLSQELPDYILNTRSPLLINAHTEQRLKERGILLPARIPSALIAVPLTVGSKLSGALVVQEFSQTVSAHFDEAHMELLSTAVSQAATALENASLFEQMQQALAVIEKRERYQAGVAQAAGHLSEFGSKALKDVLQFLGRAGQSSRVYMLTYQAQTSTWRLLEEWVAPDAQEGLVRANIESVPFEVFSNQIPPIRVQGWVEIQSQQDQTLTGAFLRAQKISTALILQVPAKGPLPSILIFDQTTEERHWLRDEINILRVAADAIANTYVREDLLVQLQLNLEETESLYKATNQFVLAGNFQEMLAALMSTVDARGLNRASMVLFERDEAGAITSMRVGANWHSGVGTPPETVGSLLPARTYQQFLHTTQPIFIENTLNLGQEDSLPGTILEQNIQSLVMLPMWSGKRQIGSLLVQGEQQHPFTGRETRIFPPLAAQLTIAVENLRLFEQTQAALAETGLLYNVSSRIAQAQSADEMVQLVVDSVLPHGADKAAMMLAEFSDQDEINGIEIVGFLDTVGNSQLKGMRLRIEDMPVFRSLNEDGLMITDVDLVDAASRATLTSCGVKSIAFVPMRSGGHLIGLLSVSCRSLIQFNPAEIRVLRTVANGIAVALEKQRLLREAQRHALELQTASEIARDTTSTLSLDLLLNRIVNLLCERFGYYHTSIYFIDEDRAFAVLRESSGEVGAELKRRDHRIPLGSRSIVGSVSASGETIILNDVTASPLFMPHPLLPETHAEMTLPLRIGSRIIGVLDIQSQKAHSYVQEDANVLSILTDQIAIAIENARAYELAQKAIENMREVDRVKSQFLANMSHELRTPLNSIIGFSRVILKGIDGPTTETQQQDLTAIYTSGQHLLLLINDILDLSKIEAGKMDLSFSDVSIAEVTASALSTAVGLIKDKPIKLSTIMPPDLPVVRADSNRIRQVLINFLSNAAKFTEAGTITVEAFTAQSPQGQPELLVTVTDSGPGIAERDRSKLFLPFSQVDDSPTRKTGGTGLGLSICHSLIEMHNGRIGLLHSEVGKGSTFFFSLPLTAPEIAQGGLIESSHPNAPLVLSIDDDIQVINLYQRYLQPQGYTVLALTDPNLAVETARRTQPIAITLDVMMPNRDGWQVMQDLKDDPQTREIPIIVCSLVEEEEKGFNLGATDYLVKPFLQDELLNALQRINQVKGPQQVLVIDDDEDDLRLTEKMLGANPLIQVSLARGGEQGLAAAKNTHPNAIILDLMMPGIDGFQVLTQLRADPYLDQIPVIVLSGADLTLEQHRKLAEMGKQLLTKAYLREKELLNTLGQALKRIRTV